MDMTVALVQSIGDIRVEPRPTCVLCGGGGDLLYEALIDHQYGVPGTWSLRQCRNAICGLAWQDPMIIADDLPLAYKAYFTHAGHDSFGPDSIWRRVFLFLDRRASLLQGLRPERKRYNHGFLDDLSPGTLLDVGCGNGDFAARMQSRGWAVRGIDVDPHAASAANQNHGFRVDIGELEDLAYPDGTHDAVTARHVIEHVRDPREFVQECWRILKPGGRLVLVTPNVLSLGHHLFRDHWLGLEPPRHLILHSAHSLRTLATQCGIQPTSIFSTAQGASYIFRSSERARTGKYDAAGSWARTLIKYWFWQFLEVRKLRSGDAECGEELVLIADKPASASAHDSGNGAGADFTDPADAQAAVSPRCHPGSAVEVRSGAQGHAAE